MDLWVINVEQGEDDYGAQNEPSIMAVCTSAERAGELASTLWGYVGPGLPDGVTIEHITSDEVLSSD